MPALCTSRSAAAGRNCHEESELRARINVMDLQTFSMDAQALREQLMAADPMQRAHALHALEQAAERAHAARRALAAHAERFAARGIPFYALRDRRFRRWVGRAVSYWERLHGRCPEP